MQSDFDPLPKKPPYKGLALAVLIFYLFGTVAVIVGGGIFEAMNPNRSGTNPFGPGYFQQTQGTQGDVFLFGGMALGALLSIVGLVCYIILLIGMWGTVQDGRARLSPGAGTALAVIPIVNLVGIFFGFYGLSQDLTRVARERGLQVRTSDGLALAACICWVIGSVLSCIPLIGCVFSPVGLTGTIMWFVAMFKMANAAILIETTPADANGQHVQQEAWPAPY